jgi:prepilin-type N-terminal cleavage/methylation domain-containing protein
VALSNKSGFSLIEVLISLVFVGALILVSLTFILPLRLTRTSNIETRAIAIGQSYIELVKSRWQTRASFQLGEASLPTASTTGTPDIKLPDGWILEVDGASSWINTNTIRTLKVTVKPKDTTVNSGWIVITTKIARPS